MYSFPRPMNRMEGIIGVNFGMVAGSCRKRIGYSYFAPAWQERVLDEKPKIPYLHMTDIRDPEWCKEHGLTLDQAQNKMDMAAILISQMGSLVPAVVNADAGLFLDAHGKKKIMKNPGDPKPSRFLIDHYCFNAYVWAVLHYIHVHYPDTEKVDFVVELKEGVFEKLKHFFNTFGKSLDYIGEPHLKKYLGELTAVSKDRVPVQAADMLCWHVSRADLGLLRGRDANRAATIFHQRKGPIIDIPDSVHLALAESFAAKNKELEEADEKELRIRQLRPHNAGLDERSAQRDKSRSGRGKSGKTKKKAEG